LERDSGKRFDSNLILGEATIETIMKRRRRQPTRPGEILHQEFLLPLGMTQKQLADHLGCDVKVINRIVNGRTSVTAETALKLAATFRTTAEFWLNAQKATDLYEASARIRKLPRPVRRARTAATGGG
jgi:addiction module HigA family antidote